MGDYGMLKSTLCYLIGVGIDMEDKVIVSIDRRIGSRLEHINTVTGKEAEMLYEKLTNKNNEGEK